VVVVGGSKAEGIGSRTCEGRIGWVSVIALGAMCLVLFTLRSCD
jgi:hypothetical protein